MQTAALTGLQAPQLEAGQPTPWMGFTECIKHLRYYAMVHGTGYRTLEGGKGDGIS
jgi:hypothetical protein